MTIKTLFSALFCLCIGSLQAQQKLQVTSPDGQLVCRIGTEKQLTVSLSDDGKPILTPSPIALVLEGGEVLGTNPRIVKTRTASVNRAIPSPFYKRAQTQDRYNQLTLSFKGGYGLILRMYDDGMAYRFTSARKGEITIENEVADYRPAQDFEAFAAYVNSKKYETFDEQYFNSFENRYVKAPLTQLDPKRLVFLPMLLELNGGAKLCITEADLDDYPGMYLNSNPATPELKGVFAPCPKQIEQGGHNNLQMLVREREAYIAKTAGTREFPWRAFIYTRRDGDLITSDMVYKLAAPSRVADTSWIAPGKVAWEWWNDWNLYGVDFRAGINNDTYKHYIDFAAKNGIEYVILDEGWAVRYEADLLQVIPEIDIAELVAYGRERNVGIILWAGYYALERDLENVVKHYADMGVKGFKVDFLDRDDQPMIDFMHRTARICADHKMLVDFHGVSKPTGLQRTYPNVINYEGVFGLEQLKWSKPDVDMVEYDVTVPFIRMVAGPMDYTQGAMRNAAKGKYYPDGRSPMSQGTRCHQLAEYVVFESPLNMLCDSPSNYEREQECIDFISEIPTVWDDTRVLDGQVGEYIAVARRAGDVWYVGAITDWAPRDLELTLPVTGDGYRIEIFRDGVNADRAAQDYKREQIDMPADGNVKLHLAPGGGWAARITKK